MKEDYVKLKSEAREFVDKFKAENGSNSFISIRIRNGYIGKEFPNGTLQLKRSKPRGTLVAIKKGENDVSIGVTYLSNKDYDIPIVGVAEALKDAVASDEAQNFLKVKDKELFDFFKVRAKCYFYPELYSHDRGTNKLEYPNYDKIHKNRERALKFIGREDLI